MPGIYIHSILRELMIMRPGDGTPSSSYVVARFQDQSPQGLMPGRQENYAVQRYRQLLRPFIHTSAAGYEEVKALTRIGQHQVNHNHQGSWEEAIVHWVAKQAQLGMLRLYIHKYPILSFEHFKQASQAAGLRNKIGNVDTILKKAPFKKYAADVWSQAPIGGLTELEELIKACDTYLGLSDRQTSARRPAVQVVRTAAMFERALFNVKTGDYGDKESSYFLSTGYINARSRSGQTALGVINELIGGEKTAKMARMVRDGADLSAPQRWGLRPIDIARAKNNSVHEFWLEARGAKSSRPSVVASTTVDALCEATISYELTRDVRQAYTTLHSNPLFQPLLDLAAKDARKTRSSTSFTALNRTINGAKKGLSVFFFEEPTTGAFRSAAGAGNYELANNTLGVCGKAPQDVPSIETYLETESRRDRDINQKSFEGTLIHELAHFAAFLVYDNSSLPYTRFSGKIDATSATTDVGALEARAYYGAYVADWKLNKDKTIISRWKGKRSHMDQASSEIGGRMDEPAHIEAYRYVCLFGHVFSYATKFHALGQHYEHGDANLTSTESLQAELVAGVGMEILTHLVQAIHVLGGRDEIAKIMPNTLAWYEDVFLPAVRTELAK